MIIITTYLNNQYFHLNQYNLIQPLMLLHHVHLLVTNHVVQKSLSVEMQHYHRNSFYNPYKQLVQT
ncbi:unnamed protein product [Schistosoma curassoni]|uniref:Ovule protein n=1 Tax=Schistosoma curassoni TaxID=6186 RepID=A0A183JP13_9TREM|nr:unnamed protein product [Schistosoma curassoni]